MVNTMYYSKTIHIYYLREYLPRNNSDILNEYLI